MLPAIFGLSGPVLTDDERAFFRDCDPAGYILFGRNIESRAQVRALTDDLRALHGRDRTFICIDQEGGRVARMKPPVWLPYPPGEAFDRLYDVAPASAIEAARANAHALGLDLAEAGISVDCLPLLDVRQPGAHDVIGDRALGTEPQRVAALGRATLDGLARAGIAGVVKHMPGHGRSLVDSHKETPLVTASAQELELDLAPFRTLKHATIGMTGHLRFTAWDAENPATLSPFVIEEIIRKTIGFDGLLLTDDLDMQALGGAVPDRAVRAQAAGCDIALNCWAKMDDMVGIAKVLAPMSAKTAERLERALAPTASFDGPADVADQTDLLATRDQLLALA
ncbi:MAG: beta-N-acetylhexosaminidase [Novosphingobium sp. 28-62-57]|uniref:beta-N-acetylhexosaminidase n=1 Tax=unclassified Novosphingobium TaxID=2644732 RepID=UPI000BD98B74|nr:MULTISPECIES: beta-N-acetylhexosaminidase [unclassified Novosphingobium]OYW50801.1 MAG: beta-N-acetylhexosaminidase [Novosphingobium sp. 12-62-10]OYZ10061.1 MAG: beta-N-acetylhexosaminidase [Novosphingobium sp. 28-62-57]OZA33894.1 MAG: beta-N-acetylhexosaminidase [Novosphingobium sp. 17-62-9]HQS69342.1 beta-N-acetylhexosaminidase [Novosphingobium sp.]